MPAPAAHLPLSQSLARLLEDQPSGADLTLNRLLERTEGRGLYLILILLALPFVLPISLPGVSTVLGLTVAILAFRLALRKPPRLPRRIGEHQLSAKFRQKILGGSLRLLRGIERLVKPRRTPWMSYRGPRAFNAVVLAFMGLLLALPFPPLPPFTNSLPGYSIILLAASMMEEDGVTIWIGYAVAAGTTIYLALVARALEAGLVRLWELLRPLLGA